MKLHLSREEGIRTPGPLRAFCFQDRCVKPLRHLSMSPFVSSHPVPPFADRAFLPIVDKASVAYAPIFPFPRLACLLSICLPKVFQLFHRFGPKTKKARRPSYWLPGFCCAPYALSVQTGHVSLLLREYNENRNELNDFMLCFFSLWFGSHRFRQRAST